MESPAGAVLWAVGSEMFCVEEFGIEEFGVDSAPPFDVDCAD
jgi:hypothetical protein